VRDFAPPSLEPALQRSQLSVWIDAGVLTLQPLKQLARCPSRLGLEPSAHLRRHRLKRVRAAAAIRGDLLQQF